MITLIELPLVLPPAAAGIALLAAFGPKGLVGGAIEDAGIRLVLETAGVVVALTFVAAPFYVRGAIAAFESLDRDLLEASRTLGAGEARTFARVAIPVRGRGLASGLALAWGRALGEFGATLMFAGSLQGTTQTAPLAIFEFLATRLRRLAGAVRRAASRSPRSSCSSVKLLGGEPEVARAAAEASLKPRRARARRSRSSVGAGANASRSSARPAPARARCCGSSPA